MIYKFPFALKYSMPTCNPVFSNNNDLDSNKLGDLLKKYLNKII
jgi:hypothetical protein